MLATGYLAEAEAAYRRSEVEEYFLFPAGRLRQGKASVEQCQVQPLGPTAVRDMFRHVEDVAGVPHQPGRAFYGLRRQATDLAPEFAQDARVLNRLSGQHREHDARADLPGRPDERVRARAAEAGREMRRHLRALTEGDEDGPEQSSQGRNLSHPLEGAKNPSRANAARALISESSRGRTRTYDPLINSRVGGGREGGKMA
ncbi:MAG: hypothetical protein GEU90_18090 [Gemmatimonas sp.]|nr:hypothetical protein [Gemmatimonas sp.]